MNHFEFDNETLLTLKHSHPDFYRLLREFEVSEKPYHETLDKEKFRREVDLGLHNVEDYFGKQDIMEAIETFSNEKAMESTLRKTASVGTTEIATEYYYVSLRTDNVYAMSKNDYKENLRMYGGLAKIFIGHKSFCYLGDSMTSEEANKKIDKFLGYDNEDNKQLLEG